MLLGLLLLSFARLIMLPVRGEPRTLGHLPLHSSREPSRPGLGAVSGSRVEPEGRRICNPHVLVPGQVAPQCPPLSVKGAGGSLNADQYKRPPAC